MVWTIRAIVKFSWDWMSILEWHLVISEGDFLQRPNSALFQHSKFHLRLRVYGLYTFMRIFIGYLQRSKHTPCTINISQLSSVLPFTYWFVFGCEINPTDDKGFTELARFYMGVSRPCTRISSRPPHSTTLPFLQYKPLFGELHTILLVSCITTNA